MQYIKVCPYAVYQNLSYAVHQSLSYAIYQTFPYVVYQSLPSFMHISNFALSSLSTFVLCSLSKFALCSLSKFVLCRTTKLALRYSKLVRRKSTFALFCVTLFPVWLNVSPILLNVYIYISYSCYNPAIFETFVLMWDYAADGTLKSKNIEPPQCLANILSWTRLTL